MAPRRDAPATPPKAGKRKDTKTRDTLTQRKKAVQQEQFLAAYSACGNILRAARLCGIDRTSHYRWMTEPEYRSRFEDATENAADALEEEARRRAVEGVEEPVGWHQGVAGGMVRKYSDTLLIFLLKGARPEKFRDRYEHTGRDGGPIEVSQLTPAERASRVLALVAKAEAR